jgi:hypothetical protein
MTTAERQDHLPTSSVVAMHNGGLLMTRQPTWLDLWTAPMRMAATAHAIAETAAGAQAVIAKRTPMIFQAFTSPWTADIPELTLMVSEKVSAFNASTRSMAAGGETLNKAIDGQVSAMRRLGSTGWLSPMGWWDVAERNLTVVSALMTLPGDVLAPYHKGVTANARRLGARPRRAGAGQGGPSRVD